MLASSCASFTDVCRLFAGPAILWKFPEDFGDQVGNIILKLFKLKYSIVTMNC